MDTERFRERSSRLRTTGAIQVDLIRKYVGAWKEMGLLHWGFMLNLMITQSTVLGVEITSFTH